MNVKIRNHYNSREFVKKMEVNDEPSLTIPDEAMTIGEMVTRFANDIPMNGKIPVYDGDVELTDLQRLDLSERHALLEEANERIEEARRSHEERKRKADELRFEKIVADRVALRIEELGKEKGGKNEKV